MTRKPFHAWFFSILSLAIGLGYTLWFGARFVPFLGLLMGPPETHYFPAYGAPALLAGVFGFLRAKPEESMELWVSHVGASSHKIWD